MNRTVLGTVAGYLALTTASVCWAYELNDVRIEWWTGAGEQWVLLVVDFWPGNGDADSFAFGYAFDGGEITGFDLLNALQAADRGFSYATLPNGFVTDIWYVKDGTTYHTGYVWPDSWWKYCTGTGWGEWWAESWDGPGTRLLHPGDTDGWLALPGDDWTSVPITPLVPQTRPGDMNCDGVVNFADVNTFVLALTDGAAYYAQFPGCNRLNADCNHDGHVNFADINPFVIVLHEP